MTFDSFGKGHICAKCADPIADAYIESQSRMLHLYVFALPTIICDARPTGLQHSMSMSETMPGSLFVDFIFLP